MRVTAGQEPLEHILFLVSLLCACLLCRTIPSEELLFSAGGRHAELFTLDAPMATTPLAPAAGYAPKYSQGFLANLDKVRSHFMVLSARGHFMVPSARGRG